DPYLRRLDPLRALAADVATGVADVLALRPDALLIRWTHAGTERIGGGRYERHFLMLWEFGADGLALRNELFDSDREDEALARFDELAPGTAEGSSATPTRTAERRQRRVRANLVTAGATRLDAVMAARD